jgi:DNA replication protein DnaC
MSELIKSLRELRLTGMADACEHFLVSAQEQCWDYPRLVQNLIDAEQEKRASNRRERLLKQSKLPASKTLQSLNEDLLPLQIRRQLPEFIKGKFVDRCQNICAFGLPGRGKTHLLCAVANELVQQGRSVLFIPAFKLVQRLLEAKSLHQLDKELIRLDRFEVILLDDIGYVQHSPEEMEVLFTFIAERYERRSLMISSNLPFSKWGQLFRDPMTAMAAVDRLVQHSIILHFEGESIRSKIGREKFKSSPEEPAVNS